jgi:hypothetical protein
MFSVRRTLGNWNGVEPGGMSTPDGTMSVMRLLYWAKASAFGVD